MTDIKISGAARKLTLELLEHLNFDTTHHRVKLEDIPAFDEKIQLLLNQRDEEIRELRGVVNLGQAWRRAEKRHALIQLGELKGGEGDAAVEAEKRLRELRIALDHAAMSKETKGEQQ